MKEVSAVKTKEDVQTIHRLLEKHSGNHFADIWRVGINIAARISDLLNIRYTDIDFNSRELTIIEQKTKKQRTIRLNDAALDVIQRRRSENPTDEFLFQSHSNRGRSNKKPLNRSSVARVFKEVGEIIGIKLGTHSMRKTRGYFLFKSGVSIEQICKVLNHSSPAVTMAYIGLDKETTLQTYDELVL